MVVPLHPPLLPSGGTTLNVLGICRISTVHQDLRSLDDQEALLRRYVAEHYDGSVRFHVIKSQASGEYLDRGELRDAEDRVENGQVDLVLAEDLGRICRRNQAVIFCELCEDRDTRLIALNDSIDTGRGDWRMHAIFASFKHESSNKDTSQRIRRTLRHRFMEGGIVQTTIFGYIKPEGTTCDSQLRKDPTAEPIYDELFRRLEGGASFSEAADWLNELGVAPGAYCRTRRWTHKMIARIVRNPLIKGTRVRNKKMARRVNKTGRRRAVNAPPVDLLERRCPHLQFIEPERFDRINALITGRNAKFKRGKGGIDPRTNVPKKRTAWPGQHLECGICGRLFYFGGHGQSDHLMCRGAIEYHCWNGITACGPLSAARLTSAIMEAITALPDFDDVLTDSIHTELARIRSTQADRRGEIDRGLATLGRQIDNILASLRENGPSRSLSEELRKLEADKEQFVSESAMLERGPKQLQDVPPWHEIKAQALADWVQLAPSSPEFGRLMHQLIPRIRVEPYRPCDGGRPVLRAKFALELVALVPAARGLLASDDILRRELVVDLFNPPQRIEYRERVMALKAQGLTERQVAAQLGITQPAVQHAAALTRKMAQLGLTDPYVPMLQPPDDDGRLRRHKHPRYRFLHKDDDTG